MKLTTLLVMLLVLVHASAATLPKVKPLIAPTTAISRTDSFAIKQQLHQLPLTQRLALKLLYKKLAGKTKHFDDGDLKFKKTIALIALISGILGGIFLFLAVEAALVLGIIAIVTGAIGFRKNKHKQSRIMALIGMILGISIVALILLALIVLLSFWGGFF